MPNISYLLSRLHLLKGLYCILQNKDYLVVIDRKADCGKIVKFNYWQRENVQKPQFYHEEALHQHRKKASSCFKTLTLQDHKGM